MSDYVIFVSEKIGEETGRDPDEIAAEIVRGDYGNIVDLVKMYGLKKED